MEGLKNSDSPGKLEPSVISGNAKEVNARKGIIDTAAPFDSVKAAVHKFGGVVGWRARKVVGFEKHTDTRSEFEKVQEEIPKYKKQSEAAETAKSQVLEELESTKRFIEELRGRVEKTEAEVAQAKNDSELFDCAKAKHEESVEELKSVNEELESLRADYHHLINERDLGIARAQEALSAAKDAEKRVEDLKEELKQLDQELSTNNLKPKLGATSSNLAFHVEGGSETNKKPTSIHSELASTRKQLEEVKASIEKKKVEVNFLRETASSLKTELERETENVAALKQREEMTAISSLEAELCKMQSELELVVKTEKEARKTMEQLPKAIEQAARDADQAKSTAHQAREELRNGKEELEQAIGSASTMEARLLAAIREIEAAKSSEALAVAAVKAMRESEVSPVENGVKLQLEEYYTLTKSAYYGVSGNQKVISAATEKIEEAKNSELMKLEELKEAQRELEEKKEAVKSADETAQKAHEGRLAAEKEMRDCRAENNHRRIASDAVASHYEKKGAKNKPAKHASSLSCPDIYTDHTVTESKPKRKKTFFPRILMFLARKKAQSLK